MFAKLYSSARSIISSSPSVPEREVEQPKSTPRSHEATEDMVTTRAAVQGASPKTTGGATGRKGKRGHGDEETKAENSSKRRKQSNLGNEIKVEVVKADDDADSLAQASTTTDPKKIAIRNTKKVESEKEASDAVEEAPAEANETTPRVRRRASSPKVVIAKETETTIISPVREGPVSTQETEFYTPATHRASSVCATPSTQIRNIDTPSSQLLAESNAARIKDATEGSGKKGNKKNNKKMTKKVVVEVPPSTDKNDEDETTSRKLPSSHEIPSSTVEAEDSAMSTQQADDKATPVPVEDKKTKTQAKKAKAVRNSIDGRSSPNDKKQEASSSEQTKEIAQPKKAHIRFDEEQFIQSTAEVDLYPSESVHDEMDEDSASDSDEAPETVTVASAVSKAKKVEEEATRAYQAIEAKEKQKRKERAERLAEEQKQKKKREDKKAKKLAKLQAQEVESEGEEDEEAEKLDIHNLPTLLPDFVLNAAPEKRPPTPPPAALPSRDAELIKKEKLNRHIQFLEHGEKPAKDKRKGPVNVHVLEKKNPVLPPKANRDTRNIREHWLKGRQVQEKKNAKGRTKYQKVRVQRKPFKTSFLRNGDDD